jgi:hypothetical protein
LQELLEAVGRDRVRKRNSVIVFRNQRNRREIAQLEAGVLVEDGVDRLEVRAEQEVVAVGRLRQYVACCEHSRRTGLVFDDEALAEQRAELVGDETRRDIGRAAGAETDDEPHGSCGIGFLRLGGRETNERCETRERREDESNASPRHSRARRRRVPGIQRVARCVHLDSGQSRCARFPE